MLDENVKCSNQNSSQTRMFWPRPLPQHRDREAESDLLIGQTGPRSVQDVGGTVGGSCTGAGGSPTDQLMPHVIIWVWFIRHQLVLVSWWVSVTRLPADVPPTLSLLWSESSTTASALNQLGAHYSDFITGLSSCRDFRRSRDPEAPRQSLNCDELQMPQ